MPPHAHFRFSNHQSGGQRTDAPNESDEEYPMKGKGESKTSTDQLASGPHSVVVAVASVVLLVILAAGVLLAVLW